MTRLFQTSRINDAAVRAMPDGPRHSAEPEPVSRLGPVGRVSLSRHGAQLVNPRLITTRVHKPPIARGHRSFIGKVEWRTR